MLKSDYDAFEKFKLIETEVKELMTFDRAAEMIIGRYSEQGTSDVVVHSYSYFTSWITAKSQATSQFTEGLCQLASSDSPKQLARYIRVRYK